MSQQGERRTSDDDWWTRLYDEPAPDNSPAAAGDTLDDRFESVAEAVSPPVPDPRSGPRPPRRAPRVPEQSEPQDRIDPEGTAGPVDARADAMDVRGDPMDVPLEPGDMPGAVRPPAPGGIPPRAPWQPRGTTAPPGSGRTSGWWEPADSPAPPAPPPPGYEPAVPAPPAQPPAARTAAG
ncbi:hypothetical protein ACFWBX_12955, partial [Streptomyces sp. NPDC059991]